MKSKEHRQIYDHPFVTLHVRVWIEMSILDTCRPFNPVTLHVRVWIEIFIYATISRGSIVTLHVRVWIEIKCFL